MTWIHTVPQDAATGRLRRLFDQVKGPDGKVDNILLAHSLRPHSLEGHMAIYKNVLHHSGNEVPKWFLEVLGVYVSALNECSYCVEHHAEGLARLLGDAEGSTEIDRALRACEVPASFDDRQKAAMAYARSLTGAPSEVAEADIERMRAAGWQDGEILEINQVVAYFAYANRTVLGLGVNTDGDVLGLSPSGDDWNHR